MSAQPQNLQQLAEALLYRYRYFVISLVLGIASLGLGAALLSSNLFEETKVEVLSAKSESQEEVGEEIVAEISGSVESPGVYKLAVEARIDDLLVQAGGLSSQADRSWVEKNLNRASKLVDGQKIYIPEVGEIAINQTSNSNSETGTTNISGKVNINSASLKELDKLSGIGEVRAQAIIDNRPYATTEELVSKKVLPKSIFDKIKEEIVAF